MLGRFFAVLEYTHVGNNNSSAYPSYLRSDCVEYEGGRLVLKCKKEKGVPACRCGGGGAGSREDKYCWPNASTLD